MPRRGFRKAGAGAPRPVKTALRARSRRPASTASRRRLRAKKDGFLVVGLGASAGGLDAVRKLLADLPTDTGLTFVLIQHLDRTHESMMVDLLRRDAAMKVLQAADGMPIERDCLYVIPPQAYLSIRDGVLRLSRPRVRQAVRMPFDLFLQSLADEFNERAVCVVLSGTGTDGSVGLKAVSKGNGLVVAQDPEEAAFDGMPRSAIATGAVNLVLRVAEMPQAFVSYARHADVREPETSRRELQSLNEKLTTSDRRLQGSPERQRITTDDLLSILTSSEMATLLLDKDLRIRFFTPAAVPLFNLIAADIGRPLADLAIGFVGIDLVADARRMLAELTSIKRRVRSRSGASYLCSISPYRTQDNRIDGVVINLAALSDLQSFSDGTDATGAARKLAPSPAAELANLAKSRFLAAASHDLRQPLQTLRLLQGVLRLQIKDLDALTTLTRAEGTLETMAAMLNALLDINQLETRAIRPKLVDDPVDELPGALKTPVPEDTTAEHPDADAGGVIYVVDDDRAARDAMQVVLAKAGYSVKTYASAATFLGARRSDDKSCLITDVRMPGMNGFELLAQLAAAGSGLPAIVITGQGDITMAVQAMKAGAVDFIEKPSDPDALLASVDRALRQAANPADRSAWRAAAAMRLAGLTRREREVMDLVVAGRANKHMATRLGISQRTVETHRAAVMKKMGASSLSELIRLELAARIGRSDLES
jgi:FixJ family two-component response regulator/signal transduction histidine kinase